MTTEDNKALMGRIIVRFAQGQAVEHWGNQDDLGMLQQLGIVPAPGQGGG